MGRKDAVNTPRLKKSRPFSSADIIGSPVVQPGNRPVQSLVKKLLVPPIDSVLHPLARPNKPQK
jgi:hypothetical protein